MIATATAAEAPYTLQRHDGDLPFWVDRDGGIVHIDRSDAAYFAVHAYRAFREEAVLHGDLMNKDLRKCIADGGLIVFKCLKSLGVDRDEVGGWDGHSSTQSMIRKEYRRVGAGTLDDAAIMINLAEERWREARITRGAREFENVLNLLIAAILAADDVLWACQQPWRKGEPLAFP
jgi:hypothetical protein